MAVTFDNAETQANGLREFILDDIKNVSPKDRPVMAAIAEEMVENTTVSGLEDSLDTPSATNAKLAGSTTSFALADAKVRSKWTNYVQELEKAVSVDLTLDSIKKVGIGRGDRSEMDYQKERKLDALLNDAEATIVGSNTATAPATNTGTTGYAAGMQTLIATNKITANSGTYGSTLTKPMYNELNQKCYSKGGKPDKSFMGAMCKDAIAGWVTQVNRPVSDAGKKLTDVVNQVETTTGMQDLILERNLSSVLLMLEAAYWKIGWLAKPYWREVGVTGDFNGGYWRTKLTVLPLAEKSSGQITGLGYTI